jgi:hypothetical protein
MRSSRAAVAAGLFALTLGVGVGAATSGHGPRASQFGLNTNGTSQEAPVAKTERANTSAGSASKRGTGGSDSDGRNGAETKTDSENGKATEQDLSQEPSLKMANVRDRVDEGPKADRDNHGDTGASHSSGDNDQSAPTTAVNQDATDHNSTDETAGSGTETSTTTTTPPASSGPGDVEQPDGAGTKAESSNENSTEQDLDQKHDVSSGPNHGKGSGKSGDVSEKGSNENRTEHQARSTER